MTTTLAAVLTIHSPHGVPWEFLLLFAVVIAGPAVVERARIPGLLGLLLGGFLIGPHGFGWIGAGNTTVPDLGQLGLLYLMFVAGVELDLGLLSRHRRTAVGFGVLTFALPMALGTTAGFALGWEAPAAILLGSLLASHTLLLYPMVRDAGLTSDAAVASAVGATVLTDTIALVVLAAVAGTQTGSGSPAEIALDLAIGLAVLLAGTLLVLPRLAAWAFKVLGMDRKIRYAVAVASFLAAATLADMFGIEGIVGAFFAGLALNRLVPNEGVLMDRIEFFGGALFIPVFLVSVGLIIDPAVMVEGRTLGLAGLFILACLGGKGAAALIGRPLLGFTGPQSGVVFALTSPQAAATLAATIVGFDIGLFGTSVVNAVLVLILASVVVATLVGSRATAQVEPPRGVRPPLGARVLVAVEDPESAAPALALAGRVAAPDGGVVRAVVVGPETELLPPERVLARLQRLIHGAELDGHAGLVVDRTLLDGAVHAAAASDATLVLLGDAPHGLDPAAAIPHLPPHVPLAIVEDGVLRIVGDRDSTADRATAEAELSRRIGRG